MCGRLPDYDAALASVLALVDGPIGPARDAHLTVARGRVLAEDVRADRDLPPFNRAMMDGYALRAADFEPGRAFPVVADISAGAPPQVDVPAGACVKIATGAAVPDQLDTVIEHELSDRSDPVSFTLDSIEPGHAVHPRGADAKRGEVVIPKHTRIGSQHIGIAASVGEAILKTCPQPTVMIITSGDEVRGPGAEPIADHHIRNSNGPMLVDAMRAFGSEPELIHVRDDLDETIDTVQRAAAIRFDVIITVGGVSAGERDHFPAAFAAAGFEMSLRGAAIQPGRPVTVGRLRQGRTMVIGLPGNPVSALVCAHLFGWPLIRKMQGLDPTRPWREVELVEPVKPNPHRRAFRPARLVDENHAVVPKWAGSGDLVHTAGTHGIIELPVQGEPVDAGARLRFLPWAC